MVCDLFFFFNDTATTEIYTSFPTRRSSDLGAHKLDKKQQQQLSDALSNKLERKVNLQVNIDKSLLGGAVIRAGDTVIDGSIRGRLTKLAESLNS